MTIGEMSHMVPYYLEDYPTNAVVLINNVSQQEFIKKYPVINAWMRINQPFLEPKYMDKLPRLLAGHPIDLKCDTIQHPTTDKIVQWINMHDL
jgi:hypothetical protein